MSTLEHMAARVASDPHFLANALMHYAVRHALTDVDLCERLGCDADTLTRLRLCRAVESAEQVEEIATRLGVDAEELERVVSEE